MPLNPHIWAEFSADPFESPDLRASDADRGLLFDAVGEAYATGLLDTDEHEERLSAAGAVRTLGDAVPVLEGIVAPPGAAEAAVSSAAHRDRALAQLRALDGEVPVSPEAIDAAARAQYMARVKRDAWGLVAGPVGICLAIWAFSSIASGSVQFFWPLFVILGVGGGFISTLARRSSIIEERRRVLTLRARAHLGDAEAARELDDMPRALRGDFTGSREDRSRERRERKRRRDDDG